MLNSKLLRSLRCGLALAVFLVQAAIADAFDDLEIHGFVTQGFIKTSANSFFGDSENGSFDFTELGVNATTEPYENVRLSGQLLSRRAGDMYSDALSVDYALADITLNSTYGTRFSVLVGRIKNPFGFYNEARDVAFARPSVFVPQVIYFDNLRNVIHSSDGVGLRLDKFGEYLDASLYVAVGQPRVDENIEYAYLGREFSGDFDPDGLSAIARLLLETPNKHVRASISFARTSLDFDRSFSDPIKDGEIEFDYWIASVQYNAENYTITAEYMREPIHWTGFEASILDGMSKVAEGYYMQAAWQIKEDVELMVRYEEGFFDRNDRSGKEAEYASQGFIPSHTQYSKIATMGLRWDVSSNLMLRAEYQKHNGTFVLSNQENESLSDRKPNWDMFAFSASYRF